MKMSGKTKKAFAFCCALALMLTLNAIAIFLRTRLEKRK